jgi:hypothetical protein
MVKLKFCLLSLSAVFLSGCITVVAARPVEKIDTDHAIPPMGNMIETGALGYAEKKTGFFFNLFSKEEERIPAEGEILAKGSYKAQGKPEGIIRLAYPQKNKNLAQVILESNYHQYYKWAGDIMFSGRALKANFLIDADGTQSGGRNKTFLLDTAKTESFRFEFSGPIGSMSFDASDPEIPNFPWWVGDFIAQDKTYRLYAVVEIGSEYEYPPGVEDPYAYETRKHFFYPEQKFQIVDVVSNTVVAEICRNAYTLYDTTPETEREAMKCNIGLFYAVLQASKQTDASPSW